MMKSSEIKQVALTELKGKWQKALGITSLFTLVNIAISYIFTVVQNLTTFTPILYYGVNIIYLSIYLPLSFGLISSIRKLLKGEDVNYTTFLNEAILNFSKTIAIFLRTFLKMLLPCLAIIIAIIGMLLLTTYVLPLNEATVSGYAIYISLLSALVCICIAISVLPYSLSSYILSDNGELKAKKIVEKSASLIKNNKWNLVKLIISFVGWIFLIAVISNIIGLLTSETVSICVHWFGMIFLMPYLLGSMSVFYEETLENK